MTRAEGSVAAQLASLLAARGEPALAPEQLLQLEAFVSLLLRWNAKLNLTAVRDKQSIVRRHVLESVLSARLLPPGAATLLDYGSGAGFPGIPCSICRPEMQVTLTESQSKKAAFLAEAIRTLGLRAKVHAGRVETLPPSRRFDIVTLRAVDKMAAACAEGWARVGEGGWIAILATQASLAVLMETLPEAAWRSPVPLKGSEQQVLLLGQRA